MNALLPIWTNPARVLALCVAVSSVLILGAHLFERIGGLPPCLLCLDQREAHWAAITVGALTLLVTSRVRSADRTLASALGALTLIYTFSAGLAGYHAGVEWGFWPGPACSSELGEDVTALSGRDILASLDEAPSGPSCSEALWRLFGLSMAGYNAVVSLGLAVLAMLSCSAVARGLRNSRVGALANAE